MFTVFLLFSCFFPPLCSLLYVETADRPGLLVDLVKIITDIDIAVESGEFDTEVVIPWHLFACFHCFFSPFLVF